MVIKEEIEINAPVEIVYQVTSQVEKFPEFIPDVKNIKILSKEGNKQVTFWEASIDGIEFKWEELDIYYPEQYKVDYKLIKGDADKFEGYWQVDQIEKNKSKLTLYLDFEVNIPVFSSLIMPTIRFKVKRNVQTMLKSIKERAEKLVL
ncbi:MAG: type II toxin-antitoxin system RatA family toxin [bacterium]